MAHHAVKCRLVALNVDTFNKDTLSAHQREFDIERLGALIAAHARLNPQEIDAFTGRERFHTRDHRFNSGRRIGLTGADIRDLLELFGVGLGHFRGCRNLAKGIFEPFAYIIGHEISVTLAREFGRDVEHLEIDIAARLVEIG